MSSGSDVSQNGVAALRALAHPTRLALLDLLRTHDTLTASASAQLLGLSPKTCSYHLHVLAGHDLVVPATDAAPGQREYPWRRAYDELPVHLNDLSGKQDPQRQQAVDALLRTGLSHNYGTLLRAVDGRGSWDSGWLAAATVHSRTVLMSAEQLQAWGEAVERATREAVAAAVANRSPDQHPVRLALYGLPERPGPT